MSPAPRVHRSLFPILGLFLAAGCGDGDSTTEPPSTGPVAELTLQVGQVALSALGDTARLLAVARDAEGHEVPGATVIWSSDDPGVASVDGAGLVRAVSVGTTSVTATSGPAAATAGVEVRQIVASFAFGVDSLHFDGLAETRSVVLEALDAGGNVVEGVAPGLSSDHPAVVRSDGTSGVTSVADGLAYLVASVGSVRDSIPATVRAVGRRTTFDGGRDHTCLLRDDGRVQCWGRSDQGQVGIGDLDLHRLPQEVPLSAEIVQISTGSRHSCALEADGAAWCWGLNSQGHLGLGGGPSRVPTPQRVATSESFTQISAGGSHSCGVTTEGVALCWGIGSQGALGSVRQSNVPVEVETSLRFVMVSAGSGFSCGLTAAGQAHCWGVNGAGTLGDGSVTTSWIPVPVAGNHVLAVVRAGQSHACGLTTAGEAYCWGARSRVGNGAETGTQPTPVPVATSARFVDLRVGVSSTCGVTTAGDVLCWGSSNAGQIGDGTLGGLRATPVRADVSFRADAVATGANHACAFSDQGDIECWGFELFHQTGVERWVTRPAVTERGATDVTAATNHTCVVAAGSVRCWGRRFTTWMRLQHRDTLQESVPQIDGPWARVESLRGWACALSESGRGACWGHRTEGTLGGGETGRNDGAIYPLDTDERFLILAPGDDHGCGLSVAGATYCWGAKGSGRLGVPWYTDLPSPESPTRVQGLPALRDLDAGDLFTCGLDGNSATWCWGHGRFGEDRGLTTTEYPIRLNLGQSFDRIRTGSDFICGLTDGGTAYCWGANDSGQLGNGSFDATDGPTEVAGGRVFTDLELGVRAACGLADDGTAYCWGENAGRLTAGDTLGDVAVPTAVPSTTRFAMAPRVGGGRACALSVAGDALCWGLNHGQVFLPRHIIHPTRPEASDAAVRRPGHWVRTPR